MVDEEKKNIPEGEIADKSAGIRPSSPGRKPDFDEEKLRREVSSIPLQKLKGRFPDSIEETLFYAGEVIVRVKPEKLLEICSYLKEDPELDMNYLSCITGVDYPEREKRYDLVYHLYSISMNHKLTLKISIGQNEAALSITNIWQTANWHEREAYDLLGISFIGHPGLERILTTETFEGHPLRKDFPAEGRPEDHVRYR